MKSPLALIEVSDQKGGWVWKVVRGDGATGCGAAARRLIWVREPTKQERQALELTLAFYPDAKPPYCLEELLKDG